MINEEGKGNTFKSNAVVQLSGLLYRTQAFSRGAPPPPHKPNKLVQHFFHVYPCGTPRETWHANCGESNSELLLKLLQIGNCSWRLQATSWVFSCVWGGFLQNKPADQKLQAPCDDIFKCKLWWWLTHLNCDPTFSPWNFTGCVILVLFTLVAPMQQYGSGAL